MARRGLITFIIFHHVLTTKCATSLPPRLATGSRLGQALAPWTLPTEKFRRSVWSETACYRIYYLGHLALRTLSVCQMTVLEHAKVLQREKHVPQTQTAEWAYTVRLWSAPSIWSKMLYVFREQTCVRQVTSVLILLRLVMSSAENCTRLMIMLAPHTVQHVKEVSQLITMAMRCAILPPSLLSRMTTQPWTHSRLRVM